jgi:uncharacterized protein YdiU (UPF0061 family)
MSSPEVTAIAPQGDSGPDRRVVRFAFENTYARLPGRFYVRLDPTPVVAPRLVKVNRELALTLGLEAEALASPEGVEILAGNRVAEGSEPLAQAYAGHQFGHFVPQLGDGRAILLGEVTGCATISNSKAPAGPRSRAAAMAGRHSVPCCASTS